MHRRVSDAKTVLSAMQERAVGICNDRVLSPLLHAMLRVQPRDEPLLDVGISIMIEHCGIPRTLSMFVLAVCLASTETASDERK